MGIGDSAEVRYNYALDDGTGIIVLPNRVYWSIFEKYNKEMRYAFGKHLNLGGKYAFINESRWRECKLGINGIFEAEKQYNILISKAMGADKANQILNFNQLKDEINLNRGVYGVYKGDKLVYIGSTNRSFDERWSEHLEAGKFNEEYEMRPLYTNYAILEDLGMSALADRELRLIEFMLIRQYKPELNIEGVSKGFRLVRDEAKDPCFLEQYSALTFEKI